MPVAADSASSEAEVVQSNAATLATLLRGESSATPGDGSGVTDGGADQTPTSSEPASTPPDGQPPVAPVDGAPAEPTDEELFGDYTPVDATGEDFDDDDLSPADDNADDGVGLTPEEAREVRELLGDESKQMSRTELKKLHRSLFVRHARGRRYHESFKTIREVEQALGREITSPQQILDHVRRSNALDQITQNLRSGREGARQVLLELMRYPDGREYTWAQDVKDAAQDILAPNLEQMREQASQAAYENLIDTLADRAASNFRNGEKDTGQWWLQGLNVLYHMRNGTAHPNRAEIMQGRYDRKTASNGSAAAEPPAPQQTAVDPEKEALRRRVAQIENQSFSNQLEQWSQQADAVARANAERALSPLKALVDAGALTQRMYELEVEDLFSTVLDDTGRDAAILGQRLKQAVANRDAAAQDFLRKEWSGMVGRAVQKRRLEVLGRHRDTIKAANARTQQAQTRQVEAANKTEIPAGGGSPAPVVSDRLPTSGKVADNAAFLRGVMNGA